MIVAGAKGLAGELLEIFFQRNELEKLYFFDNVSENPPPDLFGRFPVVTSFEQARDVFRSIGQMTFCLGLGSPVLRHRMTRDHRVNVGIRIAERQVRSIGNHSRLQPEFSLSFMRVSITSHVAPSSALNIALSHRR